MARPIFRRQPILPIGRKANHRPRLTLVQNDVARLGGHNPPLWVAMKHSVVLVVPSLVKPNDYGRAAHKVVLHAVNDAAVVEETFGVHGAEDSGDVVSCTPYGQGGAVRLSGPGVMGDQSSGYEVLRSPLLQRGIEAVWSVSGDTLATSRTPKPPPPSATANRGL